MANKKPCITTNLFTEWFKEFFVLEVKKYMVEKGLYLKELLLVHNVPNHVVLEHINVQILFLSPNTTSLIQPWDQGIIATC